MSMASHLISTITTMMSHSRRVSVSYPFSHSPSSSVNKLKSFVASAKEAGDLAKLCTTPAKGPFFSISPKKDNLMWISLDVGGGKVYEIDADVSVDTACDVWTV